MKYKNLSLAVLFLSCVALHSAAGYTFTDKEGRSFEGEIVSVDKEAESFQVTMSGRRGVATVPFAKLILRDLDFVKKWTQPATAPMEPDESKFPPSLYPRTKDEIKARIKEIRDIAATEGIEKDQQDTINELNVYRFLSGVPDEVEADQKMIEQATDAAIACEKHGGLSHDIGHSTNLSNLAMGGSMFSSVRQYINDSGANNRENRGHRRWCLNPPMGKTGFGAEKRYSAMISMDSSGGGKIRDSWAYPGKGFFPNEYMHGNGWSLYLKEKAPPAKDLTVEVYELSSRPERPFSNSEDIPGKALPVEFVSTYVNAINFEPSPDPITGRGIYWVRIKGSGVREGYLVELY
jgi:hypothetical protein